MLYALIGVVGDAVSCVKLCLPSHSGLMVYCELSDVCVCVTGDTLTGVCASCAQSCCVSSGVSHGSLCSQLFHFCVWDSCACGINWTQCMVVGCECFGRRVIGIG